MDYTWSSYDERSPDYEPSVFDYPKRKFNPNYQNGISTEKDENLPF